MITEDYKMKVSKSSAINNKDTKQYHQSVYEEKTKIMSVWLLPIDTELLSP